jgi:DNA-nicking Smr family endonuclease
VAEGRSVRRRAQLSDEELALWAHVAAGVKPLPGRKIPHVALSKGPSAETQAGGAFAAVPIAPPPARPTLKPLVPMERRMRQRVSRGRAPIDGIIDLHGMRQDEAHRALLNFLHRKHHEGAGVVIVVTGKGGGDDGRERGVLRRMVPHWLSDPGQRSYVIGYEEAAQNHGGGGALYVRIRRMREER